eukprot:467911-Ditylum_brightwellii.AAC.1
MEDLTLGLLESSLDPIFLINDHGIIRLVNRAAVGQFGWSKEEFLNQNISMIIGGRHGPRHDECIEHFLQTGIKCEMGKKRELLAKRKDGSEFVIELGLSE